MKRLFTIVMFIAHVATPAYAQWDEGMIAAYCTAEKQMEWMLRACEMRSDEEATLATRSAVKRWKDLHAGVLPKFRSFCERSPHWQASVKRLEQAQGIAEERMASQSREENNAYCRNAQRLVFHPQYHITSVINANPISEP